MDLKFFEDFYKVNLGIEAEEFSEISTDTRTLKKGSLFIALKGENFDANLFVEKALDAGASAVLSSNKQVKSPQHVCVPDSLKSMQALAQAWQKKVRPEVLAVTGSNGKTTTKFFTAQLLEPFFKICFSPKSFNNEIGVPFTQLALKKTDQVLISEIGTSNPGEIKNLSEMVQPSCSLVTTVGASHLESFKTVDNVALEKQEIYQPESLKMRIFNLDNDFTKKMYQKFKGSSSHLKVSLNDPSADLYAEVVEQSWESLKIKGHVLGSSFEKELPIFGVHNLYNLLFASAFAVYLKVPTAEIISQFKAFKMPWGRGQKLKGPRRENYLFDGYNSNPQSMESLFQSLSVKPNQKTHLVLGEMLELGEEESQQQHYLLGQKAAALSPKSISFIGASHEAFLRGVKSQFFEKSLFISSTYKSSLASQLESVIDPEDTIVLKASRGSKIENFLEDLGVAYKE